MGTLETLKNMLQGDQNGLALVKKKNIALNVLLLHIKIWSGVYYKISVVKDSINFQLHTISAQKLYSCSTNGSPCMMYYYYHSYYYYYILLLPILLYIRKSVHQKCMIIL